jgi:hypothetical protein
MPTAAWAGLLGQGTTASGAVVTASQVLADMTSGDQNPYGSISPGPVPGGADAGTTPGNVSYNGNNYWGANITVSQYVGSFVTGTTVDQAVTLLHELGHAMNIIFGAGTSGIQPDSGTTASGIQASVANTTAVITDCALTAGAIL